MKTYVVRAAALLASLCLAATACGDAAAPTAPEAAAIPRFSASDTTTTTERGGYMGANGEEVPEGDGTSQVPPEGTLGEVTEEAPAAQ